MSGRDEATRAPDVDPAPGVARSPALPEPVPEPGSEPSPEARRTGDPRLDAALAELDRLPDLPVTEHAAVFEEVHRVLQGALAEAPPGYPGPPPATGPDAAAG
jgi:hypothetical protein